MQWEQLTSLDFANAVKICKGTAILSVGVLEPHASHLPLGMDMFHAHWAACRAAELEPAIVYPSYPYGMDFESTHLPGAVAIRRETAFALLEDICDEMGRNGITKILFFSGHGGNRYFLPLFVMTLPEKKKPYTVYDVHLHYNPFSDPLVESQENGHACEVETSLMLHIQGELVKMEQIPAKPFSRLGRNRKIQEAGLYTSTDWYAMYPAMYVGDAHKATAEKGRILLEREVAELAKLILAVKEDEVTPALVKEFMERKEKPAPAPEWE